MMKDAYSPIYQEYLNAFQVGYHQMAELQVVCPCCREAVFRAEREFANGPTAYFSHYKASKGFSIAECERRVAAMPSVERERTNQEARNQSLAVFRGVLRDAVAPIPVKGRLLPEADKSWVEAPIELNIITAVIKQFVTTTDRQTLQKLTFRNSQRMLSGRGLEVNPNAQPTIRSSIAADLITTVFRDNAHRTATYLVARSMRDCFELDPKTRETPMRGRARTLEVAIWAHLEHRQDRDTLVPTLVLLDFILRELERLPYEKMIVNARNGLRPMHDVTINDYLPKEENPEFQYALRKLDKSKVDAFDQSLQNAGTIYTPGESLYAEPENLEDDQSEEDLGPRMGS